MKSELFLLIILVLILFSCAEQNEVSAIIKIDSLRPNGTHQLLPKESEEQLNLKVKLTLNKFTNSKLVNVNWEIEKIKLDLQSDDRERQESLFEQGNNNSGYFIDANQNNLEAIIAFYDEGYYRVITTISDFISTDTKSIIIKNGEIISPELYLSLNIFEDKDNALVEAQGEIPLYYFSDDVKKVVHIQAEDIANQWRGANLFINPLQSFEIKSGVEALIGDQTNDINLFDFKKIVRVTNHGRKFSNLVQQYDVTGDTVCIDVTQQDAFILTNIYGILHYWVTGDKRDTYHYSIKTIQGKNYPVFNEITHPSVHSAQFQLGTIYLKFSNSLSPLLFTVDGNNSSYIDIKRERPFPAFLYGVLMGKLGEDGVPFAIGSNFQYHKNLDEEIHSFSSKE